MGLGTDIYLIEHGWVLHSGEGEHSYWVRPSFQKQRKPGTIYLRSAAVSIQRSVDLDPGQKVLQKRHKVIVDLARAEVAEGLYDMEYPRELSNN